MAKWFERISRDVFDEESLDALLAPLAAVLENRALWTVGPQHYFEDFEHAVLPRVAPHPDIAVFELKVRGVVSTNAMPSTETLRSIFARLWDAVGRDGFVSIASDWAEPNGDGYACVGVRRKLGRSHFEFDAREQAWCGDMERLRSAFEAWIVDHDLPLVLSNRGEGFQLEHVRGDYLRFNSRLTHPTGFFVDLGDLSCADMVARLVEFTSRELVSRVLETCDWAAGVTMLGMESDAIDVYRRIVETCPEGPYEVSVGYDLRSLRGLEVIRALADEDTVVRNPYWNFRTGPDRNVCVNLVTNRAGHRIRLVSVHDDALSDFARRLGRDFDEEA